jgi:hypothetical protein
LPSRHTIASISTSPGITETSNPTRWSATNWAICSDVRMNSNANVRRCCGVWTPNFSSWVRNSIAGSSRPSNHDSADCDGSVTVTK